MRNRSHQIRHGGSKREGGFALVLTLLSLVLLTVLVVGFNAATRTEQMAARNYSYQGVASQMADLAANRAIALLSSTVTNGVITQPGRAWSASGSNVLLSSEFFGAGANTVNLNQRLDDTNGTNFFISTNTNRAFFTVPLIDVRVGNVLVGRYGFWIDDDGSRVNLNAAWTNGRASFLPTNGRSYSLQPFGLSNTVLGNFADNATNPVATNNSLGWSYFFTPRQILMLSTNTNAFSQFSDAYRRLMFQASGGPANQARGTFALPRNGNPAALDSGLLSSFGSYTAGETALLSALGSVSSQYLSGARYETFFGPRTDFLTKYGSNVVNQILVNINDAALPTTSGGTNVAFTGASAADMLSSANSAFDPASGNRNVPLPKHALAIRPAPYLNEVGVGATYQTNAGGPGFGKVEIGIWMQAEIVDPYRSATKGVNHSVVMRLRDFAVDGTYELSNNRVNFSQSKTNWNWTGRLVNTVPIETNFVVAASGATNSLYFDWQVTQSIPTNASNFVVNSVRVRPALALLYGDGGRRPPGVSIIRDWAAPEDFVSFTFNQSEIGLVSSNYPSVGFGDTKAPLERVLPTNVSYGAAPPGPLVMKSISKNDPRVRTYSWTPATRLAWTNAAPSLGSNNPSVNFSAETGIDGISNDPVIGIANMYDHPSFRGISGDRLLNSWSSAFDMSRVHTGLQWRTIQLRAQSLDEAKEKLVPDWALLEVFTVTNNPIAVPAKINVNSLAFPAGSNTAPAALAAAGLARPLAIASLLAGNTNGTNATNAQFNGANLGLPSNAVFPVSGPNSYTAVATNIARLNFSPGWAQNRPTNLPSNSIVMLAEVLEADGVSNVGNDEAANEGRVRGFYDALAASSDVFTIYSVGYATTTNGTVTGEIFLRTQVARDPSNPSRFRPVFTEPLIWK